MSQRTDAQLTTESNVIASETTPGANTATRNGAMMQNMIDSKINNDQKTSSSNLGSQTGKVVRAEDAKAYADSMEIDGGTIA